ncbi:class I SAM-dependent methyltransferase, partial [Gordonia sp. 852002-10350_SCH5691597]|uniref:class I SAM-dependent methyltransferase n=1 Tax=Gordonia sp. 852002-10350_SCH5691597 TaxID=1834085 RepID=UPI000A9A8C6E
AAQDAVEKASARGLDRAAFVQSDASTFSPDDVDPTGSAKRFDAIVFSEMLYYLPDPLATVRRLQKGWLEPTGEIVVSHYKSIDLPQARQVWKLLHSAFDVRLRSTLTTGNLTWTIEALAPR